MAQTAMDKMERLERLEERAVAVPVRDSGQEHLAQVEQEHASAAVGEEVVLAVELRRLRGRTVVGVVHRLAVQREVVRVTLEERGRGFPVDRMGGQAREAVSSSSWVERSAGMGRLQQAEQTVERRVDRCVAGLREVAR